MQQQSSNSPSEVEIESVFDVDFRPEIPDGATSQEALDALLGTLERVEVFRKLLDEALMAQEQRIVDTAVGMPGFSWAKVGNVVGVSNTQANRRFDEGYAERQREVNRQAARQKKGQYSE